ncbi:hypothetical protein [Hathewaya massiliensis]|uniref:hypothetical protein n=1 Tax=Hathewaya massiliensis TaxID=1964382 RepID=UPI00163BAF11|nr:hypothetical protein [Hathewaya massiliensis]
MWIQPKTDWTPTNYYNPEDLNRVENNTLEVKNLLEQLLKQTVSLESTITNRTYASIEFASSLSRIERNIDKLGFYYKPPGWQNTLSWVVGHSFNYVDANRLEINLKLLYEFLIPNVKYERYCGNFTCGEEDFI